MIVRSINISTKGFAYLDRCYDTLIKHQNSILLDLVPALPYAYVLVINDEPIPGGNRTRQDIEMGKFCQVDIMKSHFYAPFGWSQIHRYQANNQKLVHVWNRHDYGVQADAFRASTSSAPPSGAAPTNPNALGTPCQSRPEVFPELVELHAPPGATEENTIRLCLTLGCTFTRETGHRHCCSRCGREGRYRHNKYCEQSVYYPPAESATTNASGTTTKVSGAIPHGNADEPSSSSSSKVLPNSQPKIPLPKPIPLKRTAPQSSSSHVSRPVPPASAPPDGAAFVGSSPLSNEYPSRPYEISDWPKAWYDVVKDC